MPVTPTYPGIYIEEVLSNAHTITAAPTSVTVFVGYTHPFKTRPAHYAEAVEIFSFADYEREFGGLFSVGWLADDIGQAVFNFFLNGGAVAWIVALKPQITDLATATTAPLKPPTLHVPGAAANTGILFTGLEPVDDSRSLTVAVSNLQGPGNDIADVVITYGTRTETFRKVSLASPPPPGEEGNALEARIGTAASPVSTLVTVSQAAGETYPTTWPSAIAPTALATNLSTAPFTSYLASDFTPAFEQDGALDKVAIFNLLLTPGIWDPQVVSEALSFAERKRAFMILDAPADTVADKTGVPLPMIGDVMTDQVAGRVIPKSQNGALYFPWLRAGNPETGAPETVAPSGAVAGIFAREDERRGVWKAPAGYETTVSGTTGVVTSGKMTDPRQGTLNPIGVNCLRVFPGIGTVVFGARTLVAANPSFAQYRYVPVRRTALFLEQSLEQSLKWVIFEPNDVPLWVAIRTTIENFMLGLFHQGAFQGTTPSQAFQVICDATTTTPDDQANGIVNIVVAFAPLKPAEFVVIKLAQLAGQTQS
jgi:phage tail sheath protein FI